VIPSRNALNIRYMLLPYLYTLFYRAHVYGETVARPLLFEFPDDTATYPIDKQFFWGSAIMIIPILEPNATSVTAYIPAGRYYASATPTYFISKGQKMTFTPEKDGFTMAIRGGNIIPVKQYPVLTTTESRKKSFEVLAVLDQQGSAKGELYWDDGDSLDTIQNGKYNLIDFSINKNVFSSKPIKAGAKGEVMTVDGLLVYGVETKPTTVKVNGELTSGFNYDSQHEVLNVLFLNQTLLEPLSVTWN